ncbi:F-box/kelch-repeat protein At3g23880-like [Actinidia eriantha]|uniref:F-box/kelch-repeat protein At3g23880-like n=1 Tax=Actinidia eriantha TaxID=165200 RepID=UPI0025862919|nr:F-box/kelch-repeat protein At3g23880-like [Actinidia eriantha]XP_057497745.1 F-box/kelch-repeat protein At3g23880-like [Actinidia eriantha]XP_057497746.1 F-box/kelch-repeat protein At3g23880-like [Actinidia eriantha]
MACQVETHPLPKLPDELVFDILSQLPVRCLLQYRCVCKSWRNMISDARFIKTHLHRSTESPDSRRLLLDTHPLSLGSHILFLGSFLTHRSCVNFDLIAFGNSNHTLQKLPPPWPSRGTNFRTLCVCDGLILLSVYDESLGKSFVLWNPSTRSYKKLLCPYECNAFTIYGLFYDSSMDGYRVVIVSRKFETSLVLIYNSRSDSWGMIREPRYSILYRENGVPVNGNLHWVMNSNELRSWVIVRFDFTKEKFLELPRPSFGDELIEINLVVLRGYLCLCRFGNQKQVEIWAMKEYGKKESWTNLVVIPNKIETSILFNFKPLYIMENCEIVLEVESREIVIYNPNDGKYRSLKRYDIGCRAIPYVESLLLLNGEDEIGRQHQAYPEKSKKKKRL